MDRQCEGELFNLMADYYDQYRPGYPDEIVRKIIAAAGLRAGSKLLEIGSGSGKATAQFLGKGFDITCLDPGEDLVGIGNARFKGEHVQFIATRFEDFDAPPQSYDAIFSAQAFHWVAQPIGFTKCATLLKEQGTLAVFWNIDIFYDTEADRALWAILDQYNGFVACISEADYAKRVKTIAGNIAGSGVFAAPEIVPVLWEKTYTVDAYFSYLLTSQMFFQKTEEEKNACHDALAQFAAAHGGSITREYTCELYLARRLT